MRHILLAERLYKQNKRVVRDQTMKTTLNTVLEVIGVAFLVVVGNVVVFSWLIQHLIIVP